MLHTGTSSHAVLPILLLTVCLVLCNCTQLSEQLRNLRSGLSSHSPSSAAGGEAERLAEDLLAAGWLVQIRDGAASSEQGSGTKQVSRNCLRTLRHRFLVCTGYAAGGFHEPVLLKEPLIVEPRFKVGARPSMLHQKQPFPRHKGMQTGSIVGMAWGLRPGGCISPSAHSAPARSCRSSS